ncbi:MAG TPA: signal peptidase II [Bacteroidota bacterium]|nr:signal peptidase II [Bacteroidota bacterium]
MRVLILSVLIVIGDQAAKLMVKGARLPALGITLGGVPYGSSRPLLGNFLRLTYIENPGMAFGIDIGGKLFFSLFSIAASIAIVAYLYHARRESLGFRLSLAMILGGALGNLMDRVFYGVIFGDAPLFYGKVVDFLDMNFFDINFLGLQLTRWPVFNIADAAVTVGVLMLLFFHRSAGVGDGAAPVHPPVNDTAR